MRSRLLIAILLAWPALSTSAAAGEEPTELLDLHYGEALFQLYQQKHFSAIVRLLSAKKQGYMQAYEDEPDLLLGGLYLAYDMPDEAESIFQRVLKQERRPGIHDRAWLQLAKTHHRHDLPAAAAAAIERIGNTLPSVAFEERQVLDGLVSLKQGRYTQAGETLSTMTGESDWSRYGQYNRAIALLRNKQIQAGLKLLDTIGSADATTAEMKAVKDRANLVLGLMLIEAKQPEQARSALERIRVSGLDTNQALFGVGLASMIQDKPEDALPPWQMLARKDARDQAVLEVMLAIPYALSLLGDDQQSLNAYRRSITRYSEELDRTNRAIGAIYQGELLDALLTLQNDEPQDEDGFLSLLPLLLSKSSFQNRWYDYQDLHFLQTNLEDWNEKIRDYQTMLVVRKAAYDKQQPIVQAKLSGDELSRLKAERDRLNAQLEISTSLREPVFSLASSKEKKLLARFAKIDALLERIGKKRDLSAQIEKLRILRGMLIWRATTEHPARARQISKTLKELDQAIEQAGQQQIALAQAQRMTQGGFGRFDRQIQLLEEQIQQQLTQARQLRQAQAELLEQMAIAVLDDRKRQINNYLIQARFGVATLLDRSNAATGDAE